MSEDTPAFTPIDPAGFEFGIVTASYNKTLCDALQSRVCEVLNFTGIPKEVIMERVPGSHELPAALKLMLEGRPFHCLIALGVVIRGSTSHHHLVAESAGHAIQSLVVDRGVPIINGIVVTDDLESAEKRITGSLDRGKEFAQSALRMAQLYEKWTKI
tara:strand:+ start:260 stop:733 length:474 start_codon:yes stop_codon:yes gene_type:complete